jgi:GNAT superfamily N-acetyltransferase
LKLTYDRKRCSNLNYKFHPCKQIEVQPLIRQYASSLSSPFDAFLEEHILHSCFYKIQGHETIGYYAVYQDKLLTQFFVKDLWYPVSHDIFQQILAKHAFTSIFVPTSDEFLLSLILDKDYPIRKQAYFFQDSKKHISSEKLYLNGKFRESVLHDAGQIKEVSGDFFDRLEDRIEEGQLFVLKEQEKLLGIGIMEKSILQEGYASVGMYTNEEFRQRGIGRTIIHHLKKWCYEHDLTPICGCWYYNANSKSTLESAGMVSKTRLLNVEIKSISS